MAIKPPSYIIDIFEADWWRIYTPAERKKAKEAYWDWWQNNGQDAIQAQKEAREAAYTPEERQAVKEEEDKKSWERKAKQFQVDEFGRFVKMADIDGNTGEQQPIVFRWNKNRKAFSPVMNPSKPNLYLISPYKLTRDFDVRYDDRNKSIATRPPDRGAGTAEKQIWGVKLDIKRGGRDIALKFSIANSLNGYLLRILHPVSHHR